MTRYIHNEEGELISMDYKEICKCKDYKDLSLDIKEIIINNRWSTIVMPKMTGKTTLLSMLYYYFSLDESSEELFENSELAQNWNLWKLYLNKYEVIALDFSDFSAASYEDALTYISDKMVHIYQSKLRRLAKISGGYRIQNLMGFLLSPKDTYLLSTSLIDILNCYYHGEYSEDNSVLLIDNLNRIEKIARINGYYDDIKEFLATFLRFEPVKKCFVFLQVADQDDNDYYYCYDMDFLPHSNGMRWRKEEKISSYSENNYNAVLVKRKSEFEDEIKLLMLQGEVAFLKDKITTYEDRERLTIDMSKRFSKPLRQDIPLFSDNMGMRKMKRLKHNDKYNKMNKDLMKLYRRTRQSDKKTSVYSEMQNVTQSKTDWDDVAYYELLKRCSELHEGWSIRLHSEDYYWAQIQIGDNNFFHSLSKIKVYVTTKGHEVKELFIGAVERLMSEGNDGFEAMISKVERDGTICFFVGKQEFFILESYLNEHVDDLKKGNRYIAHRGMLGISRDLMDIDSHNGQQAKLISDYFDIITDPEEIDIEEMYQMFVLGWNGQLVEDNAFSKDFRNCTAQMFVIMMDTLDNLLGVAEINDNSLLLNDDKNIWQALANARCWGDLRWEDKSCESKPSKRNAAP